MDTFEKEQFIRRMAAANKNDPSSAKVYWSRHAIAELLHDNLTRAEVEDALQQGQIIEDYPTGHRPLPDCLVLAMRSETHPLHVVIAVDMAKERIFVITVYIPTTERWHHDWRTRK
jgi:hypothetical protein